MGYCAGMRHTSLLSLTVLLLSLAMPALAVDVDTADLDGDGLANAQEDSNGNGQVDEGETDPLRADTDNGGESDGSEVRFGRDPLDGSDDLSADPDGDGLPNGLEAVRGTDPKNADSDGDGVNDKDDPFPLEKAFKTDVDQDGIADEWEATHGLSAATAVDALLDPDSDGVNNREEFVADTNPRAADTDRDGIPDGEEVRTGSDPDESLCLSYDDANQTTFADVGGHFAETGILHLSGVRTGAAQLAVVGGYQSGAVRVYLPDRPVTRLEFLKMALLSSCIDLQEATVGEGLPFADMAEILEESASADQILRQRLVKTGVFHDIVRGYEADNTFHPDMPIARSEALKMLLSASRLLHLQMSDSGAMTFSDVPTGSWFEPVVRLGAALGIVQGYTDGTFGPDRAITRGEAALIILRAIKANPSVNGEVVPAS